MKVKSKTYKKKDTIKRKRKSMKKRNTLKKRNTMKKRNTNKRYKKYNQKGCHKGGYNGNNLKNVYPSSGPQAKSANFINSLEGGVKQKGGLSFNQFLVQDFINLGRQFQHGLGSTYNALQGYEQPVDPMPYKDQIKN